jgi:copper chaperone CopZ
MATVLLQVPDISCEHCEQTITQTLAPVDGVRAVRVDIPSKLVTVDYDDTKINVDSFKRMLAEEDYPVALVR